MKYWANINGVQHGPVEKQQLIGLGLTRDSYVWREGLEDWVMVQNFSELDDLFPVKPMADVPPTDDGNYTAAAETPRCEPLTEETPADEPDEDKTPADETTTTLSAHQSGVGHSYHGALLPGAWNCVDSLCLAGESQI